MNAEIGCTKHNGERIPDNLVWDESTKQFKENGNVQPKYYKNENGASLKILQPDNQNKFYRIVLDEDFSDNTFVMFTGVFFDSLTLEEIVKIVDDLNKDIK